MKKFIITLSLALFSFSALAQQTSVITGSGTDTTSYNKTKKIKTFTKSDISLIKKEADEWDETISNANSTLEKSKNELKEVVDRLKAKNDIFLFDENDPGVKLYAKKDVPTCYGENSRLIFKDVSGDDKTASSENAKYDDNVWKCEKPISCDTANGNQRNWIHDPATGKCIKPKAEWVVGDTWSTCEEDINLQRKSVKCMIIKDDGTKVESTKGSDNAYQSCVYYYLKKAKKNLEDTLDICEKSNNDIYDPCSKPVPRSFRECADLPKE